MAQVNSQYLAIMQLDTKKMDKNMDNNRKILIDDVNVITKKNRTKKQFQIT